MDEKRPHASPFTVSKPTLLVLRSVVDSMLLGVLLPRQQLQIISRDTKDRARLYPIQESFGFDNLSNSEVFIIRI